MDAHAVASTAAIELQAVAKSYRIGRGTVPAVHPLDLRIEDGEFFSLLGPSGCGKSTMLRMIAGFEDPDEGAIFLHGADMTSSGPNRRDVNMVIRPGVSGGFVSRENETYGSGRIEAILG